MSTELKHQVNSLAGTGPGAGQRTVSHPRPPHRTLPHHGARVLRRGPARDPRRPAGLIAAPRRVVAARCAPRAAAGSLVWLVLAAGLALLIVLGIGWLDTGGASAGTVPQSTALIQVRSGDTLTAIAHRMDPKSSAVAVSDRIRSLNSLSDAPLFPGQLLQVPIGPGATGAVAH